MNKKDLDFIAKSGGSTQLAKRLGFGKGGAQRVNNWKRRGIPASIKGLRPDIFFKQYKSK